MRLRRKRKPRRVICVCDVHGEPGVVGVLYEGAGRYVYMDRASAPVAS